jgi:malate/lactate dehydrogenase
VAAFLNQTPTDEQLDKITEHLRFDNFEKNESVNNEIGKKLGWMNEDGKFIRKGNPNNFIKILIQFKAKLFEFQVKRVTGKIISVQS